METTENSSGRPGGWGGSLDLKDSEQCWVSYDQPRVCDLFKLPVARLQQSEDETRLAVAAAGCSISGQGYVEKP
jgi:hypothetical protein